MHKLTSKKQIVEARRELDSVCMKFRYSYNFWGEHFGFFLVYYCEGWTELAAKFENSKKKKKKKILHLLI
jgi:hypothetical protein